MKAYKDVDSYIDSFPKEVQLLLETMRTAIRKAAPKAEESVSYGMAAYRQERALVYFGGFKNHVGLYPSGSGVESLKKELSPYKTSKGAIQFPLDKKIPVGLISKIVKLRVKENLEWTKEKKLKKK